MRAKPISFGEVLRSKARTNTDSQPQPSRFSPSLSQLMAQFEESPEEDYTLYLAPLSKGKPTSFRAMASRSSNGEQVFDSWIQRQSVVSSASNKENIRLGASRNQPQPQRDQKKVMLTSRERESREPLRSVADLVRKIEFTESSNLYFKSNSRLQLQKSQEQAQLRPSLRVPRQNQQTSLRNSNQIESNLPAVQVKLPERINVQPYIEQPTTFKQPKRKEDISDIIAGTENIHLEIAELAHKYIAEDEERQKQLEESLLIENTDHREGDKENSPSFLHADEEDQRWQSAKNQVNSYLRKITQEGPRQPSPLPRIEITPPPASLAQVDLPLDHPGYSFATREHDEEEGYCLPLQAINIPQIQEIQSERLPFDNCRDYITHKVVDAVERQSPENSAIPSTKSIKLEETPKHQEEMPSPEFEMSAKRIGSSLVFSSNRKDTPSPQNKEDSENNQSNSANQHVTLSFTEEKPQIVIKIPLDYAEAAEQFQMETVQVRQEYIETPYIETPSPDKEKWQNWNFSGRGDISHEAEEQKIMNEEPQEESYDFHAKGAQGYVAAESSSSERKYGLQLQVRDPEAAMQEELKAEHQEYQQQALSYKEAEPIYCPPYIQYSRQIPLVINEVIEIPNTEKGVGSMPNHEQPLIISPKIQAKNSMALNNVESQPTNNIDSDPIHLAVPSQPPAQPAIEQCIINNARNSSSKGSAKGSPSIFGLKKIYSSPKTTPIITQPPIVTSVFTTGQEKPKIEPAELKGSSFSKPYERSSKIEAVAYGQSYVKKAKQEPKVIQQEEFKFDF